MMSFEEFKEVIKNEVIEALPEEYLPCEWRFDTIKKSGYEYEALMISPDKSNGPTVIPALNITDAYKQYTDGNDLDGIVEELVSIRISATPNFGFNLEDVIDFDKCKNRIIPRIVNTKNNSEYLRGKICKHIQDLSILYSVVVSRDENGCAAAAITDEIANAWGVSIDEIHNVAMANLEKEKPLFCDITSMLFGGVKSIPIDNIDITKCNVPYFVLTSEYKSHGATMVLNHTIMKKITEAIGDVYIIPSSVDEVIIVPKNISDDIDGLNEMLREINAADVKPEEQLSDNVYTWSVEDGLTIA